ncbi:MAG: 23S rRNA (uracil(1939)-C(5))-methyltransferase RlmD [Gammaproteobacteria bacterium]|nr:23S rRNA (uracil(1939)-C(5))-methyltransferase RlmD [Gammaproteobacteria bacterium]
MGKRGRRRHKKLPEEIVEVSIEGLSHDGRGVARVDEKTVFVEGALPGERVKFNYVEVNRSYDVGKVCEVLEPSVDRVEPKCAVFGLCGGCSLQHMDAKKQIEAKQTILLDNFERIGKVAADEIVTPLVNESPWGYRRKARLGVRSVKGKGRVLVGFREKRNSFITDMHRCEVLHPSVGERLDALSELIGTLEAHNRIAQIEVAVDDEKASLVFRNLEPLSDEDQQKLIAFAQKYDLHIFLQPKGPDSVTALWPEEIILSYALPEFGVSYQFQPTDFTQVNSDINQQMISRAIDWLDLDQSERVLDLFCGIGNFTLALATKAKWVVGVEGSETLVERARENAVRNGIENVEYHAADLSKELEQMTWWSQGFDKVLLDPARDGAQEAIPYIAKLGASKIVYVSCNPSTLARDAGLLVNEHGYKMVKAGVMDMFPHTAHVESIALFIK